MKKTKYVIIILSTFVLISSVYITDKALHWRQGNQLFYKYSSGHDNHMLEKPPLNIVFIGDSIIHSYPLKSLYNSKYNMINMGQGGDSISEIHDRYFEKLAPKKFDIVIIEGGINDILGAFHRDDNLEDTKSKIIHYYDAILTHSLSNNNKTFILSILPVTKRFLFPTLKLATLPTSYDAKKINKFIKIVNLKLEELCKNKGADFIDAHEKLLDEDKLFSRSYATPDGYHVNIFGYKALTDIISQHLY
jgi:lysophospholipase L1-like esterase